MIIKEINSQTLPESLSVCGCDCSRRDTCLCARFYNELTADIVCHRMVSPKFVDQLASADDCPQYRGIEPQRVCYGLLKLFASLPRAMGEVLRKRLIDEFGRKTFYAIRRGDRPIVASEQERISAILSSLGFTGNIVYDTVDEAIVI